MAITAGNGVVADGLQGFHSGVFGFFTAHFEISNFAIFAYYQCVAEDGWVAQLFHKRTSELGKSVTEDDNLSLCS